MSIFLPKFLHPYKKAPKPAFLTKTAVVNLS